MTVQRLGFLTSGGVWCCARCAAELTESTITHRDDCRFVADIAAAERDRIIKLAEQVKATAIDVDGPYSYFADLLRDDPKETT
jgi:hypothetical protein